MEEKQTPKLVGNKSDGHNYKYTSLGDLVIAGVELPPMRVAVLTDANGVPALDKNGNPIDYIEAKIGDEWIRGARIVVPTSNRMNEAQAYGAALTYARRYTALTVLGIACDDDNKIEVRNKEEADEQILINMSKELEDLYKKAGGKNFKKWCEDCGGISADTYPQMKAKLLKQINDNAEKESK